jgi:Flp pilus assembly protein TadG
VNRRRVQRGSVSVELVLLTPLLVSLLCLTVAFGRVEGARADLEAASRAAARAASTQRTPWAARMSGERAARAELDGGGYRCDSLSVEVDTSRFAADSTVTAAVTCTLYLSDVTGMGVPSTPTFRAAFSEPLDRYRGTR